MTTPVKKAPAKKAAASTSGSTTTTKKDDTSLEVKGDVSAPSEEGTTGDPNAPAAENPNPQNLEFIHNEDDEKIESKLVERGFKFEHNLDPARAIPGTSDYLDHRERRDAEIQRARVEQREPDLENPPSTQGTPLTSTLKVESQIPFNVTVEPDVVLEVSISGAALDADKDGDESNDNEVKSEQEEKDK